MRHRPGVGPSNPTRFGTSALLILSSSSSPDTQPFPLLGRFSIGTKDYNLTSDILSGRDTHIVYAWHPGKDIGKHAFNERGGIKLNFANGTMISPCDGPNDYYALHGALLLLAWLVVAPYGIYQARSVLL